MSAERSSSFTGRRIAAHAAAMRFLEAFRSVPLLQAQNRLLSASDRDLSTILYALSSDERVEVLAAVGPVKADRLRDSIQNMGHVFLDPDTIAALSHHLALHLTGDHPLGPASRYYRPRKSNES